jgi:hypothetical protein
MEKEFLIVDNHIGKNGSVTTEFKECDGKIMVKHFSGVNSENFIVKKQNGKKLEFSFFKLNGIYYINLNGHHIIDYKQFINIKSVKAEEDSVRIRNPFLGEIVVSNCDIEIFQKSLTVMRDWMKQRSSWLMDLIYYFFH